MRAHGRAQSPNAPWRASGVDPERARRYSRGMATPDTAALGEMIVQDVHGQPVRFGSAWESQPVLFVFLRHFG